MLSWVVLYLLGSLFATFYYTLRTME